MLEITDEFGNVRKNVELFWHKQVYKVIMFVDGEPTSFIVLEDEENTPEKAVEAAKELLDGGGMKL